MVGSYKTLIHADEPIPWIVFKEGFRSTHIPDGLMELKRKEFLNLKQGDMPFMDFLNRFNYLARYAHEEITTEARKVKLYRDRLNLETDYALSAHEIYSMKSLVDKALRVESSEKKVMEEQKRKWLQEFSQGLNTQHCVCNDRRFNGITATVIKLAHKVGQ
ncbi:hypothetical protein E2562_026589 [Oryza meyeriana var. granulata]|uniref:Retrotransposon gag domain-containing protein n=1 Tax=Oryza meyeriana var. granulata TaxID=110450 RepID=A0A6G1CUR4_9ORYZ|nr:hypothetical protein E2562_026589 [Oryza meyeriana var. granulata]